MKEHFVFKSKYSGDAIIKILEFQEDIFVALAVMIFQHIVGISMGTNSIPSLSNIFFLLIWRRVYTVFALNQKETVGISVHFTHRYIDDVLFIHNQRLRKTWARCIPSNIRSEIASYQRLLLSVVRNGQFHTSIHDKLDDFKCNIRYFFFYSWVTINQLLLYVRVCSSIDSEGDTTFK